MILPRRNYSLLPLTPIFAVNQIFDQKYCYAANVWWAMTIFDKVNTNENQWKKKKLSASSFIKKMSDFGKAAEQKTFVFHHPRYFPYMAKHPVFTKCFPQKRFYDQQIDQSRLANASYACAAKCGKIAWTVLNEHQTPHPQWHQYAIYRLSVGIVCKAYLKKSWFWRILFLFFA